MRPLITRLLFTLALATAPALAATAPAPALALTDLGVLPGYNQSFSYAVSDNGQFAVGWLQQGSHTRAFRWSATSGMALLELDASATASRAFGVNNSGVVAGERVLSATRREATLWDASGSITGLGTLPNPGALNFSSVAFGVNDAGTVAGWSDSTESTRAFAWTSAGGMASLGSLASGSQTRAYSINAAGDIVGWGTSPAGDRGFVADPALTAVGALSADPGSRTRAFGISNANGWVTGDSADPASGDTAFLWSPGSTLRSLGLLPGAVRSFGADVNSSATAVGWVDGGAGGERGFWWSADQGMVDLNDLVLDAAGWQVQRARSINDQGQVLANALNASGQVRAVLLSPVPEPSTALMLLAGLLAVPPTAGVLRRRAATRATGRASARPLRA